MPAENTTNISPFRKKGVWYLSKNKIKPSAPVFYKTYSVYGTKAVKIKLLTDREALNCLKISRDIAVKILV